MEFICQDTGIGMTEEFQKHIFEPFAQEYTGSRTKFVGTGLGMAIVKEIIQAHGENIDVVSTEGVGSEFIFSLPLATNL